MPAGTITTITDRGFGFIQPEGLSARDSDIFFQRSVVAAFGFDRLQVGQKVTFELGPDPRNPRRVVAVRVEVMQA